MDKKKQQTELPKEKRYIIRKYIMGKSVADVLRKEPKHVVDDVYIDDDWMKNNRHFESAIGFEMPHTTHERDSD